MATYFYVYPFGVSGTLASIPTVDPMTGEVSYQDGFTINYERDLITDPTALPIPRDQFNQLMYDITNNLQQYQTQGTPYWITAGQNLGVSYPYPIYARVAYDAGSGMQIWENTVAANTATPGADDTWRLCDVAAVGNPPGTIIDFGGTIAPTGYLACDGSSYLTATYPTLFAAIGYTWGGSGANFLVPNLLTRVTAGAGGAGIPIPGGSPSSIVNVGDKGGAATHLVGYQEMPPHNHVGGTVPSSSTGPGGSISLYGSFHAPNQTFPTTLPYNPLLGSQTAMTIVQPTAMTLKCIKY